jgi:hypothetical protein
MSGLHPTEGFPPLKYELMVNIVKLAVFKFPDMILRINPFRNHRTILVFFPLAALLLTALTTGAGAQIPAFPGAEGYGKYTSGGRGGSVYEVTNLNDAGPGSLRDALSQSNRTVVFRVSGDIELKSELVFQGNNMTVAGQTAPGDGICVRDYPTKINGNNIIVRYMRFRLGDRYELSSDALDINDQDKVILDHCTMSWGVDECFSAYGNTNITVQYCIIGEGLNLKGHSMGGLWGGYTTYHHNLIHSNGTRHPKYAYTYDEDITDSRNNVIYNWGYNSAYTSPTGRVNLANNYYKAGPATSPGVADRIVQGEPTKRMYITGNYVDGFPAITEDNWNGGVDPLNGGLPIKYDTPFTVPNPLPDQSAEEAYLEVIAQAGASYPARDDADNRVIRNVLEGTGSIIIHQSEVGGFPRLRSAAPPEDADHDGMPDAYENSMGLDKSDPSDRNGDLNGNGYTNLEDYINGLPVLPSGLPKPGFVHARALSDEQVEITWFDMSTGESGFRIERSTDSLAFSPVATTGADTAYFLDQAVQPLTPYFYRIASFNDTAQSEWVYTEGVRTFATGEKPGQAIPTSPENNAREVPVTGATLQWTKGDYTLYFNVYLGQDENSLLPVASATTATDYQTGALAFATDYFWRIDAGNANGVTQGQVRKFTTLEGAEPELVLYWPFREEDGLIVRDSSDNHNDGTLKNVPELIRTDGPFNRAIDLRNSGPTGHIEVPDNLSIAFDENPFSVSFWMREDAVSDSSIYLFHKGSFNSSEGTERNGKWFGLEMRDGNFRFSVDDNHTKSVVSGSKSSFVTGEWVHVVVVRDIYMGRLSLYKNKTSVANAADNTGDIRANMPLIVGNSDHMYPQYYGGDSDENTPYTGELAEFVICRHPLSAAEINGLYQYNQIPTFSSVSSKSGMPLVSGLTAFPNPFRESVCAEFSNGVQNHVLMEVYDIHGRLVYSHLHAVIPNTLNRLYWDGAVDGGRSVGEGIYLLRLKDVNGRVTGQQVLIRE